MEKFVTMEVYLIVCLIFCCINSVPSKKINNNVSPEYLDLLLKEGRYGEFNELMDISIPNLSILNEERPGVDPSMNVDLFEGDILLSSKQMEQVRQGIRFDKRPQSRWPNEQGQPSQVPYTIATTFTPRDRQTIVNAIGEWNEKVKCVKLVERQNQDDYVMIIAGNGCFASLGRTGGQQSLSLGRGCVKNGIVLHEFEHTIGFHHEHNRSDRDDFVQVLWRNIPPNWWSQYRKTNPDSYGLQASYDYYSVMHYPTRAPTTGLPAFRYKQQVDQSKIGQREDFSPVDLQKIEELYCPFMN